MQVGTFGGVTVVAFDTTGVLITEGLEGPAENDWDEAVKYAWQRGLSLVDDGDRAEVSTKYTEVFILEANE